MKRKQHWGAALTLGSLVLSLAAAPGWAGRIHRNRDTAFEITRIVSRGTGFTETIAPSETFPAFPIAGETFFFGWANRFPEFARIFIWDGLQFRPIEQNMNPRASTGFRFEAKVVTPEGSEGALISVVFRFNEEQVRQIQNHSVLVVLFPQPTVGEDQGDTIEGLMLRAP